MFSNLVTDDERGRKLPRELRPLVEAIFGTSLTRYGFTSVSVLKQSAPALSQPDSISFSHRESTTRSRPTGCGFWDTSWRTWCSSCPDAFPSPDRSRSCRTRCSRRRPMRSAPHLRLRSKGANGPDSPCFQHRAPGRWSVDAPSSALWTMNHSRRPPVRRVRATGSFRWTMRSSVTTSCSRPSRPTGTPFLPSPRSSSRPATSTRSNGRTAAGRRASICSCVRLRRKRPSSAIWPVMALSPVSIRSGNASRKHTRLS